MSSCIFNEFTSSQDYGEFGILLEHYQLSKSLEGKIGEPGVLDYDLNIFCIRETIKSNDCRLFLKYGVRAFDVIHMECDWVCKGRLGNAESTETVQPYDAVFICYLCDC